MTGPASPPPPRSPPRPTGGWEHEAARTNDIRNSKYRLGVGLVMIEWLWIGVAGLTTLPLSVGWSWARGTRLPEAAWALVVVLAPPTAALSLVLGSLGSMLVIMLVSLEFFMDCAVHGYRFAFLHGEVRR